MPVITITKLDLSVLPGTKQIFWMRWARADAPTVFHTLPDLKTDPFGNVINTAPSPYQFVVPHTPIIVSARNQNKCADWFSKTFFICELVTITSDIT